ncbi:MAG: hypothetical protein ABUT20_25465 [Bacteroidota bacterium]
MNTNQSKPMPLRAVVTELLSCYSQANNRHSSQVINIIPSDVKITRGENWLAPLMGDLYSILSSANENEVIYISAGLVMGELKLYVSERKTIKPATFYETPQQVLPTRNVLPAKFRFGFRA